MADKIQKDSRILADRMRQREFEDVCIRFANYLLENLDLNESIKKNFPQCRFFWITDGNYWLSAHGKSRFRELLTHFDEILNIHSFAENIAENAGGAWT